jgi:hypothetical protein
VTFPAFPMLLMADGVTQRLPASATLILDPLTQSSDSPFDGSRQTIAMPGAKWHGTMVWGPMPPYNWRVLGAFLSSLQGSAGRFTYTHPMVWRRCLNPVSAIGSPVVNGGSQTGSTLVTNGWTPYATIFVPGDFFSFVDPTGRPRMHQVTPGLTGDGFIDADAGGNATLSISPPLRVSPNSGAALTCDFPLAVWMLNDDKQGTMAQKAADGGGRGSTSLDIIEALV